MFGAAAVSSYATESKTRCLDAIVADREHVRFVLGTSALQASNRLHVVQVVGASNAVRLEHVYAHPDQILALAPSPFAKDLILTCGKPKQQAAHVTLWQMTGSQEAGTASSPGTPGATRAVEPLAQVATLPTTSLPPCNMAWNPDGDSSNAVLATMHCNEVRQWKLDTAGFSEQSALAIPTTASRASAVAWDPHEPRNLSFAADATIHTWDTRSPNLASSIVDAHLATTRDVQYNPNKPHTIVSGGDDGMLKFWDLRNVHKPVLALPAHTHWVRSVRYNRFHDQLVLSSSSDATAALWRVSSISSAPIVELEEQDLMNEVAAGSDVADSKIQTYEEHQDAVYATAWSASDSWIFASVSYDGQFVAHQVPSTEKYKILL